MVTIEVVPRPSAADRNTVGNGLRGYNRAAYRRFRSSEIWVLARDADGAVQAGAKCAIAWNWLNLDWLWVAEPLRGQDLGTRLMAAVEALARERGCLGVHLDTWSFQAPGFYRKQGYAEAGRVEEMLPGATRFWFVKTFPKETPP